MGLLSKGLLGDLFGEVAGVVKQVLPDPQKRREFELAMEEIQDRHEARLHEQLLAQTAVNKTEAAHSSVFVAGWRPFIGWICGFGLGMQFVILPLLTAFGLDTSNVEMDGAQLATLVLAMLGLSVPRTLEKVKGVATQFIKPKKGEPEAVEPAAPVNLEEPTEEEGPWNKVK